MCRRSADKGWVFFGMKGKGIGVHARLDRPLSKLQMPDVFHQHGSVECIWMRVCVPSYQKGASAMYSSCQSCRHCRYVCGIAGLHLDEDEDGSWLDQRRVLPHAGRTLLVMQFSLGEEYSFSTHLHTHTHTNTHICTSPLSKLHNRPSCEICTLEWFELAVATIPCGESSVLSANAIIHHPYRFAYGCSAGPSSLLAIGSIFPFRESS